ncbi:MAG TPA: hypothetical protein P5254_15440, partial [Aquihabitans sp.]|nr:hypothetical protein [Aquihabitans sp.]
MAPTTTPGNRPRRGLALVLAGAAIAGVLTLAAVVGTGSTPAAASGLERFASCDDLQAWTAEATDASMSGGMASFEGAPAT